MFLYSNALKNFRKRLVTAGRLVIGWPKLNLPHDAEQANNAGR